VRALDGADRTFLGGIGSQACGTESAAWCSALGHLDSRCLSYCSWLGFAGIEGGQIGNPWSHGLFMSVIWSFFAALVAARFYGNKRAGVVVGFLVLSHWVLDFVSHPIPFPSFSWRSWQWSYGHPLPPDLPLLFGSSPRVGLGLYNSISAVEATALELGMFILGAALYAVYILKERKTGSPQSA